MDGGESHAIFLVHDRYRFELVEVPVDKSVNRANRAMSKGKRTSSRPRSRSIRRENSLDSRGVELPAKIKTGLE